MQCNIWRICLCIYLAIILTALCFVWYVGWEHVATYVFDSAGDEENKLAAGFMLYCCLVFVATFWLPLPGFFMLLLGFFCGFWMGVVFCIGGELTSLTLSILLLRFCDCMKEATEKMPKLKEVAKVLSEEDTKFLILFRFITMPMCVKNYSLGLVDRPLWRLVLLSVPGCVYWSSIFVYFGTKAHQAASRLRKGETHFVWTLFSGWEICVVVVSILAAIGIVTFAWLEYKKRVAGLTEPLLQDDERATPGERDPKRRHS